MRKNKKMLSLLAVICAFSIIFGGVFAIFSDNAVLTQSSKVGKVDINVTGNIFHSNALNNLNPGDNDPEIPEDYRSGSDHELSFTINNLGNKSIIYRTVVEVSAQKDNGTAFTAEELRAIILSEKQNVTAATTQNTIATTDAGKQTDVIRLLATGYEDNKLTYIIGGTTEDSLNYVLNGTGDNAETEIGVTTTSTIQTFDIGLDKDISSDVFEGATITFNVIIQAMQFRGTGDAEWNNIFEKTYTTEGAPTTNNREFREEPTAYAIYSETDYSLRFYKNYDLPTITDTYNNLAVTNIYPDVETTYYEYDFSTGTTTIPWLLDEINPQITSVVFEDEIKPLTTAAWFSTMANCENMDIKKLNTEKVTHMEDMFHEVGANLTSFDLDLSHLDVSSVVDFRGMFNRTGKYSRTFILKGLDKWDMSSAIDLTAMFHEAGYSATQTFSIGNLENWNTSNVISTEAMFAKAGFSAEIFNIGNLGLWNVSRAENMMGMFNDAGHNATSWFIGDLTNWDVSNVEDFYLFLGHAAQLATNVNIGDLSKWDMSSVIDAECMFHMFGYSSTSFSLGDLSSWDTSNIQNMRRMFYYTGYAANYKLNLTSWNVSKVTNHTEFNIGVTSKVLAPTW